MEKLAATALGQQPRANRKGLTLRCNLTGRMLANHWEKLSVTKHSRKSGQDLCGATQRPCLGPRRKARASEDRDGQELSKKGNYSAG